MQRDKHQEITLNELSAEIRNKLQTATTVLELIKANKEVPKELIDKALKDLKKVEDIVS